MTPKRRSDKGVDRWNSRRIPARVAERAFERVRMNENGCRISEYSVGSHGYAQIGWQEKGTRQTVLAHRAAWVHVNGQMPLGMTLDHVCKERRCVNPEHMRMLPNYENARRINRRDWPMRQCTNGHENTLLEGFARTENGKRRTGVICSECRRIYVARTNWRKRKPGVPLPEKLLLAREKESK